MFLAVGHNGQRIVSENGTDWTHHQFGKEGEVYRAAAFGNGAYVAVGTFGGANILAVSRDGAAWKTSLKDGKYSKYLRGLAFGNGAFLAIGGDPGSVGSSSPFVMISQDGETWTDFIPVAGKNILRRIVWGKDKWVGVGDRGRRAVSADGKEWKDMPDVKAIDTLVDVAYGNGVFAGVGLHSLRMSTTDGLKWENRQVGEEGEHLNSIVWADGRFVAVGLGATYTSPDGATWKRETNVDAPLTMCYGNRLFVGVNWRGRILSSTDAVNWKQVFKSEQHLEAVAFG
jgi:hypothetical protein